MINALLMHKKPGPASACVSTDHVRVCSYACARMEWILEVAGTKDLIFQDKTKIETINPSRSVKDCCILHSNNLMKIHTEQVG